MALKGRESAYEAWLREEGVPVVRGYGVTDVGGLELGPWARLGGCGAYIQLQGMEGLTGMYVAEISPGGVLRPEKHLYDELVYILNGRGATEIWDAAGEQADSHGQSFEWQTGSLFAPPLNTWHRLMNGSATEPVRFLAVTSAPLAIDLYHNVDFIYGSDFRFADRYDGRQDYFADNQRLPGSDGRLVWHTNFIPDVRTAEIGANEARGAGVRQTSYEIAGNAVVGHLAEWPVGRYHKAHYHAGGAILLIVRSRGYTLMWPQEAGLRPYENRRSDLVVKVDWQEGSVVSPPTGWFHQHFNAGAEQARQLALRYGSSKHVVQFHDSHSGEGVLVSVRKGGTLIEYEDEDPEIRRQYQELLREAGVENQMPEELFRPKS